MKQELLALFFGLGSAAAWGAGDFSGGMASKRASVFQVVVYSQGMGLLFLLGAALFAGEAAPSLRALAAAGVAGVSGSVGLMTLYAGLAQGRMGVVSPVSAVVSAIIPMAAAALMHGPPPVVRLAGFALALGSLWLVTRSGSMAGVRVRELALPVLAGAGFAGFFILMHYASRDGLVWPLAAAKIGGLAVILPAFAFKAGARDRGPKPWKWMLLTGVLDIGGNIFYMLSSQAGRLDLAAVVSSLYPAVTVILAWWILKERLRPAQWIGLAAALTALMLISQG